MDRKDGGLFTPPGAPALNCPGCKRKVADDTAICPECDYIIDQSFLAGAEDEGGPEEDESTGVGPPPRARPAAPVPKARPAPVRARTGSRPSAPPSDDSTNVRNMEEIAKERAQRPPTRGGPAAKPAPARAPAPRRAPAPQPRDDNDDDDDDAAVAGPDPWSRDARELGSGRSPIDDPEVLLDDARSFLKDLEGADRVAFWGAALVVLSCFMPWKETAADGDFLGLISLGFISFLFAIGAMVFIGIRVRNLMAWVNPMLPWGAQMVCTVVCLVWSLVFLKISSDTTLVPSPLGNSEMMNSSPSIGCFLGVLGAVVALLGGLMGLRRTQE